MNIKKGLTRLFVVGLCFSPIVGFFNIDEEQLSSSRKFYRESITEIKYELTNKACLDMLQGKQADVNKEMTGYKGRCYRTYLFWDTIKDAAGPNDKAITEQSAVAAVEAEASSERWQRIAFDIAVYVIGYLFICLLAFIAYSVFRWVKKGFTT